VRGARNRTQIAGIEERAVSYQYAIDDTLR
jgi:hypothetical protein